MKKLRKNKFVVLIVCVTIVSILYFGIQKLIEEYSFKMNEEIIESEVIAEENGSTEDVEQGGAENIRNNFEGNSERDQVEDMEITIEDGNISTEETDLVLEEGQNLIIKEEENIQRKIYVYITGEVNIPGVVILNEGSRIVDAINAAGGITANANVSKVNLVYVLEDGMKVNIPNDNDLKDNANFEYITMNSGDGSAEDYVGDNKPSSSQNNSSIVNINTASQTELETLPGIGPSLALKIINYRKENGKFSSIEQLKDVSGIGDSKFESLKKYVTI